MVYFQDLPARPDFPRSTLFATITPTIDVSGHRRSEWLGLFPQFVVERRMVEEDFDIDSLAAYLHLSPAQVTKMAERERLPGRRIGGAWRFSRAEIHLWLEDRIGASDEALTEVEAVLQRRHAQTKVARVSELVLPDAISIPLSARSQDSVLRAMIDLAAQTGLLWDPDKMLDAVRAREGLHSTAMENGVALLHSRRPMSNILAEPFIALGRTFHGVPFGDSKGVLTDIFFLILSTDDAGHLKVLAKLSRLIMDSGFLDDMREADDPTTALDVIRKWETELGQ